MRHLIPPLALFLLVLHARAQSATQPAPTVAPADPAHLAEWISELDDPDPLTVHGALANLVAAGDLALPAIEHAILAGDAPPDPAIIPLIRQLADARFDVRERAQAALLAIGSPARVSCQRAIADPATEEEARARLAVILLRFPSVPFTPAQERLWRAVDLIGTPASLALKVSLYPQQPLPTLETVRQKFAAPDAEWVLFRPRIERVLAVLEPVQATPAFRRTVLLDDATPELQTLRALLDDPASRPNQIKPALTALRQARIVAGRTLDPQTRAAITNARADLISVLTVRQEALLVALHVVE